MPAARIQPQGRVRLNTSNPLTRGLEIALDFAQPRQLLGSGKTSIAAASMASGVTPQGITGNATGNSSGYVGFAANAIFFQNNWTSLSVVSFPTIGNCAISVVASAPGSGTADRSLFINAAGNLSGYVYDGGLRNATDPVSLVANVPYVLAATATGAALEVWKNGVKVATTATANGGFGYGGTAPTYNLGYDTLSSGNGSNTSNARFALHLFWTRALTAAEHASIAANPWQIFEGQAPMLYAASAPSAYDLTGQPTTQSNTSGSGIARQVHALSGAATAQANTAASASVTQAHALAGASAAQQNASTSGAASQGQALAGASVAQQNVSSSGALSQIHAPTGATATQANASSSGAAGQAHQLAGSAATQANTAAGGTLSSTLALAGASGTQSNASSAGAIGQVHALAGAQVAQANGSTSAAVGVNGALTGANVVQANTAGSGAATQVHALSGAPAVQGNVATSGALTGGFMLAGALAAQGNAASPGAIAQVHTLGGSACGQANVAAGGRVALFHLLTAAASNQINLSPGGAATSVLGGQLKPNPRMTYVGRPRIRSITGATRIRSM